MCSFDGVLLMMFEEVRNGKSFDEFLENLAEK